LYEKKKEERKEKDDNEIQLFRGQFLSSRVLNGMFASVFVYC